MIAAIRLNGESVAGTLATGFLAPAATDLSGDDPLPSRNEGPAIQATAAFVSKSEGDR